MIYVFEDYSLDPNRRELRCGAEVIPVEPRVFDLLQHLIGHRDRVVSKDDLIAAVWNGRIVSDSALTSRMNAARHAIGDSGEQQRLIRTIPRKGHRFVGEVREEQESLHGSSAKPGPAQPLGLNEATSPGPNTQAVTFCRMKDGTNLGIATVGQGPVLIRASHWITNIEYDWQSPITAPLLHRLASRYRLIRYDGRGTGLSDQSVPDMSFTTFLDDFETIVDSLQLERFALLGMSAGAAIAIAYAARHPHRISKLVIYGGYAHGRNKRNSPQTAEEAQAFITMMRSGWGDDNSIFWRAFSSFFLPNVTSAQMKWFLEFQRMAFSMGNAIRSRIAVDDIDVSDLLSKVSVPTIVFHCLRDNLVPFEQGRLIAASIPHAKLVPLESENHWLLSHEPAWSKFVADMETFLANDT